MQRSTEQAGETGSLIDTVRKHSRGIVLAIRDASLLLCLSTMFFNCRAVESGTVLTKHFNGSAVFHPGLFIL